MISPEDILLRLKQLEDENVSLRNRLMDSADENFTLQAMMATSEAEAKEAAGQKVASLQSELTFQRKEMEDQRREFARMQRELQAAQEQLNQRSNNSTETPVPAKSTDSTFRYDPTSSGLAYLRSEVDNFLILVGQAVTTCAERKPAPPIHHTSVLLSPTTPSAVQSATLWSDNSNLLDACHDLVHALQRNSEESLAAQFSTSFFDILQSFNKLQHAVRDLALTFSPPQDSTATNIAPVYLFLAEIWTKALELQAMTVDLIPYRIGHLDISSQHAQHEDASTYNNDIRSNLADQFSQSIKRGPGTTLHTSTSLSSAISDALSHKLQVAISSSSTTRKTQSFAAWLDSAPTLPPTSPIIAPQLFTAWSEECTSSLHTLWCYLLLPLTLSASTHISSLSQCYSRLLRHLDRQVSTTMTSSASSDIRSASQLSGCYTLLFEPLSLSRVRLHQQCPLLWHDAYLSSRDLLTLSAASWITSLYQLSCPLYAHMHGGLYDDCPWTLRSAYISAVDMLLMMKRNNVDNKRNSSNNAISNSNSINSHEDDRLFAHFYRQQMRYLQHVHQQRTSTTSMAISSADDGNVVDDNKPSNNNNTMHGRSHAHSDDDNKWHSRYMYVSSHTSSNNSNGNNSSNNRKNGNNNDNTHNHIHNHHGSRSYVDPWSAFFEKREGFFGCLCSELSIPCILEEHDYSHDNVSSASASLDHACSLLRHQLQIVKFLTNLVRQRGDSAVLLLLETLPPNTSSNTSSSAAATVIMAMDVDDDDDIHDNDDDMPRSSSRKKSAAAARTASSGGRKRKQQSSRIPAADTNIAPSSSSTATAAAAAGSDSGADPDSSWDWRAVDLRLWDSDSATSTVSTSASSSQLATIASSSTAPSSSQSSSSSASSVSESTLQRLTRRWIELWRLTDSLPRLHILITITSTQHQHQHHQHQKQHEMRVLVLELTAALTRLLDALVGRLRRSAHWTRLLKRECQGPLEAFMCRMFLPQMHPDMRFDWSEASHIEALAS